VHELLFKTIPEIYNNTRVEGEEAFGRNGKRERKEKTDEGFERIMQRNWNAP
jgi:hypothetical protein